MSLGHAVSQALQSRHVKRASRSSLESARRRSLNARISWTRPLGERVSSCVADQDGHADWQAAQRLHADKGSNLDSPSTLSFNGYFRSNNRHAFDLMEDLERVSCNLICVSRPSNIFRDISITSSASAGVIVPTVTIS